MLFSIIVPVLNEEAVLEDQLICLTRQCTHHECEVLIVDGESHDGTGEIAKRYGKVIAALRGRAKQMNAGAAAASGDVLMFLHADTSLPDNPFCAIESALASPGVVAGAFRLCFTCERWPYRLVAFTTNLRSQVRTVFTGDQAYFMRAARFKAVGGYPDQPLMEDLEIMRRLRTFGKMVLLPQCVTTSARRHEKIGLLKCVLFLWYVRTLSRFGVSPARLQGIYVNVR